MGEARLPARNSPRASDETWLSDALSAAGPALLLGLRVWASVCLALYVAFWLELDNAYWAGTLAGLMCQPHLGASLRKGWFSLIGTVVGGVAAVVLTALFPQDRAPFLVGLALWAGACAFAATLLRNFAGHGAALAGFTPVIIASGQIGATGGLDGQAFMLAITRVSEISIGIVAAGIVLAGTDFGGARRRLAALFAALSAAITRSFVETLQRAGAEFVETQEIRRELARRVIALDPVIDEALGESSQLRYYSPVLQRAVDGLFAALAGWRTVSVRLVRVPDDEACQEAGAVRQNLPPQLQSASTQREPEHWSANPLGLQRVCEAAVSRLVTLPAGTPSLRLLADQTAEVFAGILQALNGLSLLTGDPAQPAARNIRLRVPDWLPSLVSAGRTFITIGAVQLFWILTAWPNGAGAMTFAAITVILFSRRADQAYATAVGFMVGTGIAAMLAAIIAFAVLPEFATFAGYSIVIGLVLVPAGALTAQRWQPAMFSAIAGLFVPLLAPANQMSYNTEQFYNSASAILAGVGVAVLSFRLLPPLSPMFRARRLLAMSLRDLRRLATHPTARTGLDWEERMYGRLSALPDEAWPLQRSQLLAALCAGSTIIRLRHIARGRDLAGGLDAPLEALARGRSATAVARLAMLDQVLAARSDIEPEALRARSLILALSGALAQHSAYFDAGMLG
jgi:uncharacterized membrane protein YccC